MGATLVTNLRIEEPLAQAFFGNDLKYILVFLADYVEDADPARTAELVDHFADLSQEMIAVLGSPTAQRPGREPNMKWARPDVVVELLGYEFGFQLKLENPKYREWQDRF
ncbi:hypothetical protein DFR70_104456 [Nocardia tenerifensis]|uniref:Uncharacterized protein n=1 Tax=Nocardia tenerifensis TaxID=228006 RepID=A0A318K6U1_9NOCA|nr:hypothetical protein DFR70_104456 [Nocardia tenerifensis]